MNAVGLWLSFAALKRLRDIETTRVYGTVKRLSLTDIGREWGEGEWTARDVWEAQT